MNKKKKPPTQMIVIGGLVAAGLLVLVAGYLLVVSPQRSKISSLTTQIDDAQTSVIVAEGAQAKPIPFRAADLFRLAKAMPGSTDMPGILLALGHVARQSSVTLTAVHPSPALNLGLGYSAIPISITLSGTYAGITKFERLLRTSVRIQDANHLVVSGRLFDSDNIALAPLASPSTATGSGTAPTSATPTLKQQADELTATLALDAFTFGGPPPVSATAGSAVSTSGSAG